MEEVFGHLSRRLWQRLAARSWTVDLDSSVLTRYGSQEGSELGYNCSLDPDVENEFYQPGPSLSF